MLTDVATSSAIESQSTRPTDVGGSTKPGLSAKPSTSPGRKSRELTGRSAGFTLVEMMVAVALTVLMMTMVVTVFGLVMDSIRASRGSIEINDRLRAAKNRLQLDLEGLTATVAPPRNPDMGEGYFELIEGPIGPVIHPSDVCRTDELDPATGLLKPDTTMGDTDDILMFTIRSRGEPFVGRLPAYDPDAGEFLRNPIPTVQSQVAEVMWFVRGNTLYRRTLLVCNPDFPAGTRMATLNEARGKHFFEFSDLSVHLAGPMDNLRMVPNTLGDLTKRECRYAHQPFSWPYDARFWGQLGLPTLEECSGAILETEADSLDNFVQSPIDSGLLFVPNRFDTKAPFTCIDVPPAPTHPTHPAPRLRLDLASNELPFDAWRRPHPFAGQNPVTGQAGGGVGVRVGEDVILTNVISFDVKVWDPGAPIVEVDLDGDGVFETIVTPGDPPLDGGGNFQPPGIVRALERVAADDGTARVVGFGAYVDLNYLCRLGGSAAASDARLDPGIPGYNSEIVSNSMLPVPPSIPQPQFHHAGDVRSGLFGTHPIDPAADVAQMYDDQLLRASVYDTYSTHYESDGINQAFVPWHPSAGDPSLLPPTDAAVNGVDDNGNGAVDETVAWPFVYNATGTGYSGENETAPPYRHPLRGIQIKIRVFEPDTRQIREVTLEHDFVQ